MTDVHLSLDYKAGTNSKFLCRMFKGDVSKIGDYSCDSNVDIVKSGIEAMSSIKGDADFILHSGDFGEHFALSHTSTLESGVQIQAYLDQFFPETPIIFSIGNHEVWPLQSQRPNDPQFKGIADAVSSIFTNEEYAAFVKNAYYSKVIGGLRILSLNTALYYGMNPEAAFLFGDPGGQFAWIASELDLAEQLGQKVLIVGHVPPGFGYSLPDRLWPMLNDKLVNSLELPEERKGLIVGCFWGHEHRDSLRIGETVAHWIAPALTTWKDRNPGVRLYEFDDNDYSILSYKQYSMDLKKALETQEYTWDLLYTSQEVGLTTLNQDQAKKRIERIFSDQEEWDQFVYLENGGADHEPISDYHKLRLFCGMQFLKVTDYIKCKFNQEEEQEEY
ncbi:sphingomyelin phosphodiesterase [Anaeramoeba flamelloides]|uniref:Sphingomyelin phosphodiesterase n=1 Tax=Anaeramoeba flamelloides TaxID=1746091 RepID=A0ABQ8YCU7_9EUKA|nr:sphingomyelin phosphodiesterase [Anaeramoeba flamelloides]